MVHYGSKELAQSFRTVRKNTLEAARDIPEDKYEFRPTPDCRSVEKLLTHIALGYRFQHRLQAVEKRSSMEGFDFQAVMAELGTQEAIPRTKSQVMRCSRTRAKSGRPFLMAYPTSSWPSPSRFQRNFRSRPRAGSRCFCR